MKISVTILVSFFLLISSLCFSQNLVTNGDFELKRGKKNTSRPWRFVNTIDFYIQGKRKPLGTNKWTLPKPKSGIAYVGMRVFPEYREFLQIRLKEKLISGKLYYFEMFISCSPDNNSYLKQIGISLYRRKPTYTSDKYIVEMPPQIKLKNEKGIAHNDSTSWIKVDGIFKAKGGEKYLSIGNFSKKRYKDKFKKKKWFVPYFGQLRAYYFIDDIKLYELKHEVKEEEDILMAVDTTIHLPDSMGIAKEDENYIYTIDKQENIQLYDVRFQSGEATITKSSYRELELVLEYLNENPFVEIEIIGHTDDIGDEAINLKLSIKRAKSVYNYLLKNRISKSRLKYSGKGESEPLVRNDEHGGRAKNRRVEIKRISKIKEPLKNQ